MKATPNPALVPLNVASIDKVAGQLAVQLLQSDSLIAEQTVQVRRADGKKHKVWISVLTRSWLKGRLPGTLFGKSARHHDPEDDPEAWDKTKTVTIQLDADLIRRYLETDPEKARSILRRDLRLILLHELTHSAEPKLTPAKYSRTEATRKSYYRDPQEVRARTREVVDSILHGNVKARIRDYREASAGGYTGTLVEFLADTTEQWRHMHPFLEPEAEKRALQMIERALRDKKIDTSGKGALPNPMPSSRWSPMNENPRSGPDELEEKVVHWLRNDNYLINEISPNVQSSEADTLRIAQGVGRDPKSVLKACQRLAKRGVLKKSGRVPYRQTGERFPCKRVGWELWKLEWEDSSETPAGNPTRGSLTTRTGSLPNPRAIPINLEAIDREVGRVIASVIAFRKKLPGKLEEGQIVWHGESEHLVPYRAVDGELFDRMLLVVVSTTTESVHKGRPWAKAGAALLEVDGEIWPTIRLHLNSSIPKSRLPDSLREDRNVWELRIRIVHEFTHLMERKYDPVDWGDDQREYVNDPHEVRAFARESWEKLKRGLRTHPSEAPGRQALEDFLDTIWYDSRWQWLTEENRRTIVRTLEREMRDAGIDTSGDGSLPNPTSGSITIKLSDGSEVTVPLLEQFGDIAAHEMAKGKKGRGRTQYSVTYVPTGAAIKQLVRTQPEALSLARFYGSAQQGVTLIQAALKGDKAALEDIRNGASFKQWEDERKAKHSGPRTYKAHYWFREERYDPEVPYGPKIEEKVRLDSFQDALALMLGREEVINLKPGWVRLSVVRRTGNDEAKIIEHYRDAKSREWTFSASNEPELHTVPREVLYPVAAPSSGVAPKGVSQLPEGMEGFDFLEENPVCVKCTGKRGKYFEYSEEFLQTLAEAIVAKIPELKDRKFLIRIRPKIDNPSGIAVHFYEDRKKRHVIEVDREGIGHQDAEGLATTFAHELGHAAQNARGDLRSGYMESMWKGKRYDLRKVEHMDRPWEREAVERYEPIGSAVYARLLKEGKIPKSKTQKLHEDWKARGLIPKRPLTIGDLRVLPADQQTEIVQAVHDKTMTEEQAWEIVDAAKAKSPGRQGNPSAVLPAVAAVSLASPFEEMAIGALVGLAVINPATSNPTEEEGRKAWEAKRSALRSWTFSWRPYISRLSKDKDTISEFVRNAKEGNVDRSMVPVVADGLYQLVQRHSEFDGVDAVVLVPRREPGAVNDLEAVGATLAARLGVPFLPGYLIRESAPQRGQEVVRRMRFPQEEHERTMAIKGLDRTSKPLVLDNVLASGATLEAAYEVIRRDGKARPVGLTILWSPDFWRAPENDKILWSSRLRHGPPDRIVSSPPEYLWHITAKPDFKIDPAYAPTLAYGPGYTMSRPAIFLTEHPRYWLPYFDSAGPYWAVKVKPSAWLARGSDSHLEHLDYDPANAKVLEVLPLAEAVLKYPDDFGGYEDWKFVEVHAGWDEDKLDYKWKTVRRKGFKDLPGTPKGKKMGTRNPATKRSAGGLHSKPMGKGGVGGKVKQAEGMVMRLTGIAPNQVWSWPWYDYSVEPEKEYPGFRFEKFFGKGDKDTLAVHIHESPKGELYVESISVSSDKPNKLLVAVWPSTRDEAKAAGVEETRFAFDTDARAGHHFDAKWNRKNSHYTGTAEQFVEHMVKPVLVLILGGT